MAADTDGDAAFLSSIDVVSLEFRRLVAELQGAGADRGGANTGDELRLLVAPMTRALRDMAAHAEEASAGEQKRSGGTAEEPLAKRRRTTAPAADVVGTGLGLFAHERSRLFPGSAASAANTPAGDGTEQLQQLLAKLERYQQRAFPQGGAQLTFERPRAVGSQGLQLHAECPGVCTWTIALRTTTGTAAAAGAAATRQQLRVDDISAAGLDERRSHGAWFEDPARGAWQRSKHAVFASLSDAAMDAAVHYTSVYPDEPSKSILHTLMWLTHTSTLFQEPCTVCERVLSWGGGSAPTPPTCRHFETFGALHEGCT